jgi:murein hydrolase activator
MRLTLFTLILLLASGALAAVKPKSATEAEAQLSRVEARIRAITDAVQSDLAARDAVAREVRTADQALASARARFDEVRDRHASSAARLTALRADAAHARAALDATRDALARQLRSAYMGGRDEALKAWLESGDPAHLPRMLTYYGYVGRARMAQMAEFDERARALATAESAVGDENSRLAALEAARRRDAAALDRARRDRAQALARLQTRIASRSEELKELKSNAAALEDLLKRLRAALAESGGDDFGALGQGRRPFQELRGQLPWPARGTVSAHYGESRAGGLNWNGVLLDTHRAAEVRAPYYGRVAYADWLPGLGLLLVLDHGGRWMTLYGYNGRLLRKVGDRVKPGEVIAESPSDADGIKPQLYFEVREAARAVDPRTFLKGHPTP